MCSLIDGRVLAFELAFVAASPRIHAQPHDIVLSPDARYLTWRRGTAGKNSSTINSS